MAIGIERDRFRQVILVALADREMARILDCAMLHPKSVNEVIRETSIPHSTAYRKIKWMLDEGLLVTEKIDITPDGKKFSLFKSTLRSIDIKYEYGKMNVQVEYNVNALEKTAERLFSLD
jgi:predicted transcriptional regulator